MTASAPAFTAPFPTAIGPCRTSLLHPSNPRHSLGRRRHPVPPATPHGPHHRASPRRGGPGTSGLCHVALAPSCEWVERSASVVVEGVGCDALFDDYSDLTAMPQWSPWLRNVEIDKVDPAVSRWTLAARGITVSWKARNTNVQRGKIIAWQSETGLGNRGRVTFTSDPACVDNSVLTLCVEFNVPRAVAAVIRNDFIGQFVQSTLAADLKRFRTIALRQHSMRERARAQQRQQQQPQSQDVAVSTSDASVDSPNAAKNS